MLVSRWLNRTGQSVVLALGLRVRDILWKRHKSHSDMKHHMLLLPRQASNVAQQASNGITQGPLPIALFHLITPLANAQSSRDTVNQTSNSITQTTNCTPQGRELQCVLLSCCPFGDVVGVTCGLIIRFIDIL